MLNDGIKYEFPYLITKNVQTARLAVETSEDALTIFHIDDNAIVPFSELHFDSKCNKEYIEFSDNGQFILILCSFFDNIFLYHNVQVFVCNVQKESVSFF
jgi:hypothetical protein